MQENFRDNGRTINYVSTKLPKNASTPYFIEYSIYPTTFCTLSLRGFIFKGGEKVEDK